MVDALRGPSVSASVPSVGSGSSAPQASAAALSQAASREDWREVDRQAQGLLQMHAKGKLSGAEITALRQSLPGIRERASDAGTWGVLDFLRQLFVALGLRDERASKPAEASTQALIERVGARPRTDGGRGAGGPTVAEALAPPGSSSTNAMTASRLQASTGGHADLFTKALTNPHGLDFPNDYGPDDPKAFAGAQKQARQILQKAAQAMEKGDFVAAEVELGKLRQAPVSDYLRSMVALQDAEDSGQLRNLESQVKLLATMQSAGIKNLTLPPGDATLRSYFSSFAGEPQAAVAAWQRYSQAFLVDSFHLGEGEVSYSEPRVYRGVEITSPQSAEQVLGRPPVAGRAMIDCDGFAYLAGRYLRQAGLAVRFASASPGSSTGHTVAIAEVPGGRGQAPTPVVVSSDATRTGTPGGSASQLTREAMARAYGISEDDVGTIYAGATVDDATAASALRDSNSILP